MGAICNLLFISGGNNGNILVKCYALTWEMFQAFSFECYVIWLQMSSHFDICAVQLVNLGFSQCYYEEYCLIGCVW